MEIVQENPIRKSSGLFQVYLKDEEVKVQVACQHCSTICSSIPQLNRHLRSHMATKDFICSMCSRGFARKHDLLRHETSIHSTERPYECPKCSRRFKRKDAAKRHCNRQIKLL